MEQYLIHVHNVRYPGKLQLMEKLKECVSIYAHTMEQENPFYTRKHCEIKRITNVPDRATARRGGAQLVLV
jgi:hypothetical protein